MRRIPGYFKLLGLIARTRPGQWLARKIYTPTDRLIYRLTRGRRGLSPPSVVAILTTTGRKSGAPRSTPLLYLDEADRYWVVASNYGQENHPGWSYNLMADPHATIQIGDRKRAVMARLGTDAEKQRLWPSLLQLYPSWQRYREWTERDFRLFCLEPTD